MSYQSVSHVSRESYPISSGPPPSSGFMTDPPPPLRMSYQSVSHVSHESYPISPGPPPSSGFITDPPPPLPPRSGYGGQGYQAYFGGTHCNPPASYHTHHRQFDSPYENPCFSLVRGCLAALCCCFLLEQCCFW